MRKKMMTSILSYAVVGLLGSEMSYASSTLEQTQKALQGFEQQKAEQKRLQDQLAQQQQELERLRQQQQAAGGGGVAPAAPPAPGAPGIAPPPPPPPPPGGLAAGGPAGHIALDPLGTAINNLNRTIPLMTRELARDAAAAVNAAAGQPIDQRATAGVGAVSATLTDGNQLLQVRMAIQTFLAKQDIAGRGNPQMTAVLNALLGLNIPGNTLTPVKLLDIAVRAVNNVAGGKVVVDNEITAAAGVVAPPVLALVTRTVDAILFPPAPVVAHAAAVGVPIPGNGAQLVADVKATIAAVGDVGIDATIAADAVAQALFNDLTADARLQPNARAAAYAVLTSPAGTSRDNRRNRALALLEIDPANVALQALSQTIVRRHVN